MKKVEEGKKKVISVKVASNGNYNLYFEGKKISVKKAKEIVYDYERCCRATSDYWFVDYDLYIDVKVASQLVIGDDYSKFVLFDGEIENVMKAVKTGACGQHIEFVPAKAENTDVEDDELTDEPVEIGNVTVEVEDYAVSVEATEIATQAEIDAAKEHAEKLNPFSKFGSWYSDWKTHADIETKKHYLYDDKYDLVATKVEVARYGAKVLAEDVYAENALVISKAGVISEVSKAGLSSEVIKALVVFYFNPQGKPAAFVKTLKTSTYTQVGHGGRHRSYETNERLVFNKYVQADRLEYALAIFNLTVNQLVELHNKLGTDEQETLTYNKDSKAYKVAEVEAIVPEDDGSNDEPEEDFFATIGFLADDDSGDDDELIDAPEQIETEIDNATKNAVDNGGYTVQYRVNTTVDGEEDSELHKVKFASHQDARNFVKQVMTKDNFEAAIIDPPNGFGFYHVYKPAEATDVTVAEFTAEVEKVVETIESKKAIGEHVTVIELEEKLNSLREGGEKKLVYETLAMEQDDFDNLFKGIVENTKSKIKAEKEKAAKSTDSYKTAEKFLAENDLNAVDACVKANVDENWYKFFSTYIQELKKAIEGNDYQHIGYYGCEVKRIYESVKPSVDVTDYAVTPEAFEIAVQAEVDAATAELKIVDACKKVKEIQREIREAEYHSSPERSEDELFRFWQNSLAYGRAQKAKLVSELAALKTAYPQTFTDFMNDEKEYFGVSFTTVYGEDFTLADVAENEVDCQLETVVTPEAFEIAVQAEIDNAAVEEIVTFKLGEFYYPELIDSEESVPSWTETVQLLNICDGVATFWDNIEQIIKGKVVTENGVQVVRVNLRLLGEAVISAKEQPNDNWGILKSSCLREHEEYREMYSRQSATVSLLKRDKDWFNILEYTGRPFGGYKEADVDDYSVTPEAVEIAVQAEIDNAGNQNTTITFEEGKIYKGVDNSTLKIYGIDKTDGKKIAIVVWLTNDKGFGAFGMPCEIEFDEDKQSEFIKVVSDSTFYACDENLPEKVDTKITA